MPVVSDSPKLTCIHVDDSDAMRDVSRMLLGTLPWLEISGEANNGIDALELVVRLRPDIAMLDMRMPGQSGFSVATRIRELEIPTYVIVFSAFATRDNAAEAAALGVDYVSKLDGVPALLAALERARREHAARCA